MGKKKTLESFLTEAKIKYPNLDFGLVKEYVNNNTKIQVICHEKDYLGREHGVFEITPANLLNGKSCPKCNGKGFSSEDRILFSKAKHNNKYDYSKADFSRVKTKTIIICPEHGEFSLDFDHHFNSNIGCPHCSRPVTDTKSFIAEANKKHDGFYDYSKVLYENSHKKVCIICPEHGEFWQTPNAHIRGQGCPKCASSRIVLENKIEKLLLENKIPYIHNKRPKWLKTPTKGQMSLDFYLNEINLVIECQGKQHFGMGGWSERFDFKEQYERDLWKNEQCKINGVKIVYFANKNEAPPEYIGEIFTRENELMDYIRYLYNIK